MPATVISVRGRDRQALMADPDFVYVGRRCAGWPDSIWGNPFKVGMPGWRVVEVFSRLPKVVKRSSPVSLERLFEPGSAFMSDQARPITVEQAVSFYEAWVTCQLAMAERLWELASRQLGCWCGAWSPGEPEIACHAVVLARLADGLEGKSVSVDPPKRLRDRVAEYAEAIKRHGPASMEADAIREKYGDDKDFLACAYALDACRQHRQTAEGGTDD